MINDDTVSQIVERRDLDGADKIILIDVLAREPKPEKVKTESGTDEIRVGMAMTTPEQIAERCGWREKPKGSPRKGSDYTAFSPSSVKLRLKKLHAKGFLEKKSGKGRVASRYRVKFPKRSRPAGKDTDTNS
jgi:hypothetical protein